MKKYKNYVPQQRKKLKKTVGQLEIVDVVYMSKEVDDDGVTQIFAACTCEKWRSSPEATTITKVALEAKEHVQNGPCMFRQHQPDENPYQRGIMLDPDDDADADAADEEAENPEHNYEEITDGEHGRDFVSEAGIQGGRRPGEDLGTEDGQLSQDGPSGSASSDS